MREYVELGPAPAMEDCAQVGDANYRDRAMREARAFIGLIRRAHPDLPEGLSLIVKSFPHDFGSYYEVCAAYSTNDEAAGEAAWGLERTAPGEWDEAAREELGLIGR